MNEENQTITPPIQPIQVTPEPAPAEDDMKLDEGDLAIATEEVEPAKAEAPTNSDQREMGIDEMGAEWIPNPKVGESTEVLTIVKVLQNRNVKAKRKDGQEFSTALSKVDYKIDVHCDKGVYTPSCWEIWGKLKSAIRKNKEITGQEIKGTKFSVTHLVNGLYASKPVEEVRKLLELPNDPTGVATAEAEVQKAKDAQKNKTCYSLTLHLPDGTTIKY